MVPREALRGGYSIAWRECFKRNSPLDVSAGPLPRTQAHARPSDDTHYHTLAAHPTNANANTYATTNANTYATTNANANTYTTTNATTNATAAGSSGATGMAVETASIKQVGSRREFLLGCTDVGALVCFVLTWVLALALARRAFVDGEPDRLTRGSDHLGRVCGVDDGVVEFPLLYWPARSQPPLPLRQELQSAHVVPVCTSRCPPSFTNGTHPRPVGSCAPDDTARGLCTWYARSSPRTLLRRFCFFRVGKMEEVSDGNDLQYLLAGPSADTRPSLSSSSFSRSTSPPSLPSFSSSSSSRSSSSPPPSFSQFRRTQRSSSISASSPLISSLSSHSLFSSWTYWVGDLYICLYLILLFPLLAIPLGFALLYLLREFLETTLVLLVLGVELLLVGFAGSTLVDAFKGGSVGYCVAATAAAIGWALLVLTYWKALRLASSILRCASLFLHEVWEVTLISCISFMASYTVAIFSVLAILYCLSEKPKAPLLLSTHHLKHDGFNRADDATLYNGVPGLLLQTNAKEELHGRAPNQKEAEIAAIDQLRNNTNDLHQSPSPTEAVNLSFAFFGWGSVPSWGSFYFYSSAPSMTLTAFFFLFVYLWTSATLAALSTMAIAYCAETWYFAPLDDTGKRRVAGVVPKALWTIIRFHAGSAALGGLLLAGVEFLRVILRCFGSHRTRPFHSVVRRVAYAISRCLAGVYTAIRFISRAAFIQIALTGRPFCLAAWTAFALSVRHPMKFSAVATLGWLVGLTAQLLISIVATSLAALSIQLSARYSNEISSRSGPLLAIFALSMFTSRCIMNSFAVAADAILCCYVVDEEMTHYGGKPAPAHPPSPLPALRADTQGREATYTPPQLPSLASPPTPTQCPL
eukprot:GHVT01024921.1.p1 GENE.GHVT01024921.1~~GHVT01024921.1.p1  ORF type:complete len:869 (+),score=159.17 GHVT01024921.1:736-3342(+)